MGPREPAEKEMLSVVYLFHFLLIIGSVSTKIHISIFLASEEHNIFRPNFLPLSFSKRNGEYLINYVYWNTSVSIIRRLAPVCFHCY